MWVLKRKYSASPYHSQSFIADEVCARFSINHHYCRKNLFQIKSKCFMYPTNGLADKINNSLTWDEKTTNICEAGCGFEPTPEVITLSMSISEDKIITLSLCSRLCQEEKEAARGLLHLFVRPVAPHICRGRVIPLRSTNFCVLERENCVCCCEFCCFCVALLDEFCHGWGRLGVNEFDSTSLSKFVLQASISPLRSDIEVRREVTRFPLGAKQTRQKFSASIFDVSVTCFNVAAMGNIGCLKSV